MPPSLLPSFKVYYRFIGQGSSRVHLQVSKVEHSSSGSSSSSSSSSSTLPWCLSAVVNGHGGCCHPSMGIRREVGVRPFSSKEPERRQFWPIIPYLIAQDPTTQTPHPVYVDSGIYFIWTAASVSFGSRRPIIMDAGIRLLWTPASDYYGRRHPFHMDAGIRL